MSFVATGFVSNDLESRCSLDYAALLIMQCYLYRRYKLLCVRQMNVHGRLYASYAFDIAKRIWINRTGRLFAYSAAFYVRVFVFQFRRTVLESCCCCCCRHGLDNYSLVAGCAFNGHAMRCTRWPLGGTATRDCGSLSLDDVCTETATPSAMHRISSSMLEYCSFVYFRSFRRRDDNVDCRPRKMAALLIGSFSYNLSIRPNGPLSVTRTRHA